MSKYICPVCGGSWKTKRMFVEHLNDEYEDAEFSAQLAYDKLQELGVEIQ